jgi:hypothetical protein
MNDDERALFDFLRARDDVPDEELVTRINSAPDLGDAMLVELGKFMARRARTKEEMTMNHDNNIEAHIVLSDAYMGDARGPIQSDRGRVDCAFDSGYHALLAVLTKDERPREDAPSVDAVRLACKRLDLEPEAGMRLAQQRYSADERATLEQVLEWAEQVRARAKLYLEID